MRQFLQHRTLGRLLGGLLALLLTLLLMVLLLLLLHLSVHVSIISKSARCSLGGGCGLRCPHTRTALDPAVGRLVLAVKRRQFSPHEVCLECFCRRWLRSHRSSA